MVKMEMQTTSSEKFTESDFDLWTALNARQNHESWPWPKTRIFIEMYSAFKKQQGNGKRRGGELVPKH